MARPMKTGIVYFPFDVDFFSDKKIKIVKSQYGSDGIVVYIYLLCTVYGDKGYYTQVDDDFTYIAAADLNMSSEKIGQIVNFLLGRSLFNDTLFKSDKVLTSRGIQLRYQEAVKSRASKNPVTVDAKFWLLNDEETKGFIKVRRFDGYSDKNGDYSEKNEGYSTEKYTKESKVKKSKVDESKVLPRTRAEAEEQTPLQEIYDLYNEICGNKLRPVSSGMNYQRERRVMILWREYHDLSVFRKAFETAAESKFITGGWKNGGKADFDWITEQAHFVNILEGKYNDQTQSKPSGLYGSFDINEFEAMGIFDVPEVPKG